MSSPCRDPGSSSACGSTRGHVADRLIEAVAQYAREHGASCVTLWVTEINARAKAFYQRIGFVPTGARQPVREDEPDHWEEQMIRHFR
jgi:ribosomal protein S18 acetylase RimI-like enzyme